MRKFVFDCEPGFNEDDEIFVASEIRVNDIVVFEIAGSGKFQLRTLALGEVEGYEGRTYRVDKGDAPGSVRMTAI